jgi:nucleoside-diphosphate-sugar epimerase/intein/homing endonuclease
MSRNYFVTGGAGFIGSNYVDRLLERGEKVTVYDNLSRAGAPRNLKWLQEKHGEKAFDLVIGDVRDAGQLVVSAREADVIVHLAGQVAVTTSVVKPREDFEINALGTFNVLEAARLNGRNPIFLYSSTNKVYGGMDDVKVVERGDRWEYESLPFGAPETQPLDFHSPYGCSKGAGDQYVRDYYRIYGLNSVVLRQSCLAGSQPIITPFGKKPVASLQEGDLIHSGRGWTKVCKVWQTGVKPVRRLTTQHGISVDMTTNHRVMRPHGLYSNRDFAYGDFLAVLPEAKFIPEWEAIADRVLQPEMYLKAVAARTDDKRCINEAEQIAARLLPLTGDKLLAIAEIVGWLFGDGHLGIHHRQTRINPAYNVQFFGSKNELEEISLRMAWLGLPASQIIHSDAISELPGGHVIDGRSLRIQQQSLPIFTLFELLGVPVGDKVRVNYDLPEWVQGGQKLVQRAFLRGFFGAELGKVQADSYLAPSFAQYKDIDFIENGRAWMESLRQLISIFGIATSFFEGKPEEYKRGTTVQMIIRLLGGQAMFPKLASIGYAFSPDRAQRLNELLRWLWTHTTPEHFEETIGLHRADGHLLWDSLSTVEALEDQPVYDLEVEDDRHLFLAGGMQVSNCIYGPRQFGVEDQGWVAWMIIAAVTGKPISIYGDGKQIRDLLHVYDLNDAYDAVIQNIDKVKGEVFNLGGGPSNTMSIWTEFGPRLEKLLGRPIPVAHGDWRPGDQKVFVADTRKAEKELGWKPKYDVDKGVKQLFNWVSANQNLF